ncbi:MULTISPECIES: hypothetical protein [Macrococcoides]|uniref:Uncharacterized protein n=1 Tax=Staphylococcus canis TaxID=2724942 RepID=A0ABS0TB95_9STAP|nr:hypothetical protein [Macrococcus canis]MBI5976007.1 hypothetical protein [Staphylococcus canis]RAI79766.1 hypothetical protein BFS34_008565 [Macrococcus caseolyticus subsp. hominis]MCO4096152.1 hypothetical protein [Macrococcus canis]QIH74753.1 hypothetical protein GTN31_00155 [Macrococcus canis]UTH03535.1 hypothetical protein KFV05_00235 [Macrococcus canis]
MEATKRLYEVGKLIGIDVLQLLHQSYLYNL